MIRIDPAERDTLVAAFRDAPFGPHNPHMQKVLQRVRWGGSPGRLAVVVTVPYREWALAVVPMERGVPFALEPERYTDIGAALGALFERRLDALLAGEETPVAPAPGEPLPERLLAYADEISRQPGDPLEIRVSCPADTPEGSFHAELVRLICADDGPVGPGFAEEPVVSGLSGDYPARHQPIYTGSFVEVPANATLSPAAFTVQVCVYPTALRRGRQALLGTWNDAGGTGFGLQVNEAGAPELVIGDGRGNVARVGTERPLPEHRFSVVSGTYDGSHSRVRHHPLEDPFGRGASEARHSAGVSLPGEALPFRMGAAGGADGHATLCFNGKLEAPRLWSRALDEAEWSRGVEAAPAAADALVAAWDFGREISSTRVIDPVGGHHGTTRNLPTRAVRGARWDGSEHRWTHKPEHYAAIHFHDDDLYDCEWESDARFDLPADLRSGIYAAKLSQGEREEYVPFYVRPRAEGPRERLALLIPTASYYAYSNWHTTSEWDFAELALGNLGVIDTAARYLLEHPELGTSMYDSHTDGSGVCTSSRLRPVVNVRPKTWLWQFSADTHITAWLEAKGIGYDVITDDDLHAEGLGLLEPYACVMTGTHPEYYSEAMMDALDAYKEQGGRLFYTGANGFYWKVSYHPELPGVIEMRRAEDGMRGWIAEPGEYYHAFSGELGGLWRRSGRAPQAMAGTGFTAQGFDMAAPYHRRPESFDPRVAFLFEGIGDDEVIGDFGALGGGAAGWEIDRVDPKLGTPEHTLVVATANEFSSEYHWVNEEFTHTHSAINGDTCPMVRCDMVFFETPRGGAVFGASSIAWAASLGCDGGDNNVSRISENVLRRFLDPAPFPAPPSVSG